MKEKEVELSTDLNNYDKYFSIDPRTCKDVKESGLGIVDGEYSLYLKWPQCSQSAMIFCTDMNTSNPKEYVTLPAGRSNNYALHYAYLTNQEQRTDFDKVLIT